MRRIILIALLGGLLAGLVVVAINQPVTPHPDWSKKTPTDGMVDMDRVECERDSRGLTIADCVAARRIWRAVSKQKL